MVEAPAIWRALCHSHYVIPIAQVIPSVATDLLSHGVNPDEEPLVAILRDAEFVVFSHMRGKIERLVDLVECQMCFDGGYVEPSGTGQFGSAPFTL